MGIVNIFFYSLVLALVLLILAPIFYLFAGMPLPVFIINTAVGAGLTASQSVLWGYSRKGAYIFRSDGERWRLMTNGVSLGAEFVDKVREILSGYNEQNSS